MEIGKYTCHSLDLNNFHFGIISSIFFTAAYSNIFFHYTFLGLPIEL